MIVTPFSMLFLALFALIISGRFTIRLLTYLARAFGISEFTISFIILALATSLPELFIAISSSLQDEGELALSNVFGANIINMTLLIGIATLFAAGISTGQLHLKRDITLGSTIIILPLVMLLNGSISRFEGFILLGAFGLYLYLLVRDQSLYALQQPNKHILRGIGSILLALGMVSTLIIAANLTVQSSISLAELLHIPTFIIGLFVLSFGTTLPELVTTLHAAYNKQPSMVLGIVIGSNITNASLIIGLASVIQPIHLQLTSAHITTMVFVALSVILMGYLAKKQGNLSILDGLTLIGCFLLFGTIIMFSSVPQIAL